MRMDRREAIDLLQQVADNTEVAKYGAALTVAIEALQEIEKQHRANETARAIYRSAMDTFGEAAQTKKLFEEIGEFSDAFCKYTDGRDKSSHVAEEMADVHNMLDQWAVKFGIENEVEIMKRYKLRRLGQRIEEENDGKTDDKK